MNQQWQRLYQPPASPLARLGLAVLGLAALVVSFFLGLFILAIVAGLAILGVIVLSVRRAWLRWTSGDNRKSRRDEAYIDVEYTEVDREDRRDRERER